MHADFHNPARVMDVLEAPALIPRSKKDGSNNLLLSHFNLREQPFGVTPDPAYLFDTPTHREALAGLLYGIHSGLGFIALTAVPGMGKTTLLFEALSRLGKTAKTVFIFQGINNATELFRALLIDLGEKDPQGTLVDMEMRLNEILVKQNESGQRLIVVLDEAQNLDNSVLEAVRMLSNFETARNKLLQVILSGQQQLADRLAEPELLQLRQRISIFATLKPLTPIEIDNYIDHRLRVAGYEGREPLFTPEAVSLISHYSGGIPRNINNLCFNSLSIGCASRKSAIDAGVVREVISDLGLQADAFGEPFGVSEAGVHEGGVSEFRVPEESRNMFARSAPLESRRSGGGLRVAMIAALMVLAVVSAGGWYLVQSGVIDLPQISRASSLPQSTAPMKEPAPAQPPTPDPAAPQGDSSTQAPVTQSEAPPVPVSAAAQDDSSTQDTAATQTAQASEATAASPAASQTARTTDGAAPAPRAARLSKRNRKTYAGVSHASAVLPSNAGVQMVTARRGQSVVGICVEKYNGCSSALLNRIIELNPNIADAHHLQTGQRIYLPVIPSQRGPSDRGPSGE